MKKDNVDFDAVDQYGPQQFALEASIEADALGLEEFAGVTAVSLAGSATKGDLPGEYLLAGNLKYTTDLVCSRCVDPFPFANDSAFTVRYRPRKAELTSAGADAELEISDEELDLEYYTERHVDLRVLAIEQVQLSIPMKPLCEETCLGLCAQCGANLNRGACECRNDVVDQRWDSLRGIREQLLNKKKI